MTSSHSHCTELQMPNAAVTIQIFSALKILEWLEKEQGQRIVDGVSLSKTSGIYLWFFSCN